MSKLIKSYISNLINLIFFRIVITNPVPFLSSKILIHLLIQLFLQLFPYIHQIFHCYFLFHWEILSCLLFRPCSLQRTYHLILLFNLRVACTWLELHQTFHIYFQTILQMILLFCYHTISISLKHHHHSIENH